MLASGNAPPTVFATADRPANRNRSFLQPPPSLKGSAAVSLFSAQALELAGPMLRPRAGAMICAASSRVIRAQAIRGQISMKSVRPDNPDPIPLRTEPPRMGTIMIRFVGLLVVAVVALALVWSR
jgi:hypothetical protein